MSDPSVKLTRNQRMKRATAAFFQLPNVKRFLFLCACADLILIFVNWIITIGESNQPETTWLSDGVLFPVTTESSLLPQSDENIWKKVLLVAAMFLDAVNLLRLTGQAYCGDLSLCQQLRKPNNALEWIFAILSGIFDAIEMYLTGERISSKIFSSINLFSTFCRFALALYDFGQTQVRKCKVQVDEVKCRLAVVELQQAQASPPRSTTTPRCASETDTVTINMEPSEGDAQPSLTPRPPSSAVAESSSGEEEELKASPSPLAPDGTASRQTQGEQQTEEGDRPSLQDATHATPSTGEAS